MGTMYWCKWCNTRDHWADEVCSKNPAYRERVGGQLTEVAERAAQVEKQNDKLVVEGRTGKAGRPKLQRTEEEKRELRKLYMRKYRARKGRAKKQVRENCVVK